MQFDGPERPMHLLLFLNQKYAYRQRTTFEYLELHIAVHIQSHREAGAHTFTDTTPMHCVFGWFTISILKSIKTIHGLY